MVASNPTQSKGKPLTNYRAAKILGVSIGHLGRVINNKRPSLKLLRAYQALKREYEASGN